MRTTSVLTDLTVYMPATWLISRQLVPRHHSSVQLGFFCLFQFMPTLLVIDHGHFQYNSLMLALSLFSFYSLLKKRLVLATVCLTLGINFKVTTLFYSLTMATAVVTRAMRRRWWAWELLRLVLAVTIVFVFLWWPVAGSLAEVGVVLRAIFPLHRGLY